MEGKRCERVKNRANAYKCNICENISFGKQSFDIHKGTHENYIKNRKPDLPCSFCGKLFSAKHQLQRHLLHIHKETKVKCELCASYLKRSAMKVHVKSHGPKCFKCTICEFQCSLGTQLEQHMKNHANKKIEKCNTCPMEFASSANLRKHDLRIHNKENQTKNEKCLLCDYSFEFASQLQKHIKESHQNDRPFPCTSCKKNFKRSAHLKEHLVLHSGNKPYKCEHCEDSFASETSLRLHNMIHTNVKPHKCDVCGKGFRQRHHLKTHQMIHSGEKPFQCSKCGKSFRDKGDLKKHQIVHTAEKPLSCNLCGKTFSRQRGLTLHQSTHTGVKQFSCEKCEKSYSKQKFLKNHQGICTGEKTMFT